MTRSFIARHSLWLFCLTGGGCVADAPEPTRAAHALATLPNLGTTDTFALLAGTTVSSTGMSMITGDVGVSPGSAVVGFPPATLTGTIHAGDAVAATAQNDLTAAYDDLAGQACDTVLTGVDLGGMTLMPGVYCFATSAGLTGTLTLDGLGDPNAVFLFQIASTLTTASSSAVNMIGNAIPGRVFWQVGSSATLGTGTQFSGNILAQVSITATTGSNIEGRALARTGAVTIDGMTGEAVPTTPPPGGADAGLPDAGSDAAPDAALLPDSGTGPDAAPGGLSGGAAFDGCSVSSSSSGRGAGGAGAALLLGLLGVLATRGRRRAPIALAALVVLATPAVAQAQSVTLDLFHPPETSEDGLEVSRPIDLGHHRLSGAVYLDYGHDPLVYETIAGDPDSQAESIVRHQLGLHVGVAYGLIDRVILFGGASANLLMTGEDRPGTTISADGTRLGDLILGARVRLLGQPRLGKARYGALALQLGMTVPTAHTLASSSQLTGEGGVVLHPELLAEVGARILRVTFNLGTRLRSTERLQTLTVGNELTWGLGLGVPLGKAFEIDVEAYGATALSDLGERDTSPMEAIGGLRWRGQTGWTAALGAGPGLSRGYGAPDLRVVATVGWAQRTRPATVALASKPVAEAAKPCDFDWDDDGVEDSLDKCPRVPGYKDNDGCALYVTLAPNDVEPAEIVILQHVEFDTSGSKILPAGEKVLEEVRLVLAANPQLKKVAIEGHADERDSDKRNMELSQRRAEAVMLWLVEHGIDASRLQAQGYGEREPVDSGTDRESRQNNRNVQFFILDPAASKPAR